LVEDRALLCPGFAGNRQVMAEATDKTAGRETPRSKGRAAPGF
jgi:hypothetical protein